MPAGRWAPATPAGRRAHDDDDADDGADDDDGDDDGPATLDL
jgi:hypothetical protein